MIASLRAQLANVVVARIVLLTALVTALELSCRLGAINRVTMIPPTQMVVAVGGILASGRFNSDIFFTVGNIAAAVALAVGVGIFVGAGLQALPRLRRLVEPMLSAYYAIPTFIFYPLLIVMFGVGRTALIIMGAMFAIVAMIVNTVLGLDRVPKVVLQSAAMLRLNWFRQLFLIRLPAAAPYLVTGLRLAVAYSVIGIVAGEFILATSGMGKRIAYAYDNFDNNTMYGMLLLLLLGVIVVNGLLSSWERRLHRRAGQR
jgi:NitT/TauT family transport system permease protein